MNIQFDRQRIACVLASEKHAVPPSFHPLKKLLDPFRQYLGAGNLNRLWEIQDEQLQQLALSPCKLTRTV